MPRIINLHQTFTDTQTKTENNEHREEEEKDGTEGFLS
jgi:hypothetical protein